MAFISEINFAGGNTSNEWVEITLAPGENASDFVVGVYRDDGNLHKGAGIPGGQVNLGTISGATDPNNPGWTIYLVPAAITLHPSDLDEGGAVALTDVSASGGVIEFYSVSTLSAITANNGAAAGATSTLAINPAAIGQSIQFDIRGNKTVAAISPGTAVVCFANGTMIDTDLGPVLVEHLKPNMKIKTIDGRFVPLRLALSRKIANRELINEKLRPVRITAGALGSGVPKGDLLVSRQHRMLVVSKIAQRMFGTERVLLPAIKLIELPGIYIDSDVQNIEYFHLVFDQHEIIYANGTPSESFLPGPNGLEALTDVAREEFFEFFPEYKLEGRRQEPAFHIPEGSRQKRLIVRHLANNKPLLSAGSL